MYGNEESSFFSPRATSARRLRLYMRKYDDAELDVGPNVVVAINPIMTPYSSNTAICLKFVFATSRVTARHW